MFFADFRMLVLPKRCFRRGASEEVLYGGVSMYNRSAEGSWCRRGGSGDRWYGEGLFTMKPI